MGKSPAQLLAELPDVDRDAYLAQLTDVEAEALLKSWHEFMARPEQLPPTELCRWWAVLAGRGFGKNRTGAEFVCDRCEAFARADARHLVGLMNGTFDEVRALQIEGESGLEAVAERRGHRFVHRGSKLVAGLQVLRPDGRVHESRFELHTAVKPDKVRGRNFHTVHMDEVAAWEHKVDKQGNTAFSNADLALRALCPPGINPMGVITTTPKPIPQVLDIVNGKLSGRTIITRGTLFDNMANLAPEFAEAMLKRYLGTRQGEQELLGKVLDAVEGALWDPATINQYRLRPPLDRVPPLRRVVVAVDPSGSSHGDECGIIVVGLGAEPVMTRLASGFVVPLNHVYVLEDVSVRRRPEIWVPRVAETFHRYAANAVVAETNFGAALVADSIHLVDPTIPIHEVRASRGKAVRAEPVSLIYEQGRAHHVGYLSLLEEQMCLWTPDDDYSPDRMDALVWGVHELLPEVSQPAARAVSPSAAVPNLPTGAAAAARTMRGT
jgi:phage terminase large subunit-like protein